MNRNQSHDRRSKAASDSGNSAPRSSLLVVDDEQRIADTLALILASKGYACRAAYDGDSALALCREQAPDLVISDVVMPRLNGIELALRIFREFPACRVLLFSGQAATADLLEEARACGHEFDLLAKPVHPEELLATIARMLGGAAPRLAAVRPISR